LTGAHLRSQPSATDDGWNLTPTDDKQLVTVTMSGPNDYILFAT
jgi:hypothetical protein